ncbi:MAG TPA: hypothetical protein VGO91_04955 [Pyrinomonadaceae bacterium]|nr:hypothetical protein [Pyrinomonadaceae bacterium]
MRDRGEWAEDRAAARFYWSNCWSNYWTNNWTRIFLTRLARKSKLVQNKAQ